MSIPSLTLELESGEQFIVDKYMGCYYIPYENADDSYQFHCSELNHSHYFRLYKETIAFQQEIGLNSNLTYEGFLSLMERLFEMYCILRKL